MKRFCKKSIAPILLATLLLNVACEDKNKSEAAGNSSSTVSETPAETGDQTSVPSGTRDMLAASIQSNKSVAAGISKVNLQENIEAIESLVVTNNENVLIRVPLEAGITAKEVQGASLRLKVMEGESPSIKARQVLNVWDRLSVSADTVKLSEDSTEVGALDEQDNEWYVIDVTDYVKDWLDGDVPNYGIVLEETEEGTTSKFYSPYADDEKSIPELVISYAKALEDKASAYTYIEQEKGNCLSFALRDTTPIMFTELGVETTALQSAFNEGGMDNALNYVKNLVLEYVDMNVAELKVKSFRELSSFKDEIDPETEYRIALRIALYTEEGLEDLSTKARTPFDFHLQVQLEDGSWAEKFGGLESRIVPGSNRDLDPSLFNWDANEEWGSERWNEFYNSPVIFFAVEKSDLSSFTSHSSDNVTTDEVNS